VSLHARPKPLQPFHNKLSPSLLPPAAPILLSPANPSSCYTFSSYYVQPSAATSAHVGPPGSRASMPRRRVKGTATTEAVRRSSRSNLGRPPPLLLAPNQVRTDPLTWDSMLERERKDLVKKNTKVNCVPTPHKQQLVRKPIPRPPSPTAEGQTRAAREARQKRKAHQMETGVKLGTPRISRSTPPRRPKSSRPIMASLSTPMWYVLSCPPAVLVRMLTYYSGDGPVREPGECLAPQVGY
jgi:hypothetical protein